MCVDLEHRREGVRRLGRRGDQTHSIGQPLTRTHSISSGNGSTRLFAPQLILGHSTCVLGTRKPGLPIRDCARGCNNRSYTQLQLSAIEVTSEVFFEPLYLVLGLSPFKFECRVNCPCVPTPPPLTGTRQIFLDFRAIFFSSGPSFFVSKRFTK